MFANNATFMSFSAVTARYISACKAVASNTFDAENMF